MSSLQLPKLNCDVDLDELDFEVLPWLRNFGEFNIYEDPDHDYANLKGVASILMKPITMIVKT